MEYSEQQLLEKVLDGNADAMRMLYDCHVGYLTAVAIRYIPDDDDMKDILQESFVKIFTTISRFEYRGKGSLRAWMTRIVVNESLDFIARHKPKEQLPDNIEDVGEVVDEDAGYEEPDVGNVPMDIIYEMVRHLPDGYRAVFNLHVFEGKSHKEIAKLLSIKETSSASQFHRAKQLLARQINKYVTTLTNNGNERTMAK